MPRSELHRSPSFRFGGSNSVKRLRSGHGGSVSRDGGLSGIACLAHERKRFNIAHALWSMFVVEIRRINSVKSTLSNCFMSASQAPAASIRGRYCELDETD
eukprot:848296-Pleurochrysis_carterae.AAC.4